MPKHIEWARLASVAARAGCSVATVRAYVTRRRAVSTVMLRAILGAAAAEGLTLHHEAPRLGPGRPRKPRRAVSNISS